MHIDKCRHSAGTKEYILEKLETWLIVEVARGDPSPSTLRSYLCGAQIFLTWCQELEIDPAIASDLELKEYRFFLVRRNYQPATISTYLSGLRRFYEAMIDWAGVKTIRQPILEPAKT